MMTNERICERLNCSSFYAQKMIDWAGGDEKKLHQLVAYKQHERETRKAIVEIGRNIND